MNITSKLRKLRVVIVTHEYATGPSHALEKYFQGKVKKLAFIAHPFVFANDKRSHLRLYGESEKTGTETFFKFYVPIQLLNIVKDILLNLWWCMRFGSIDLYIGVDNVNASVGMILQKLGLVKQTVFYTIDYIPNRFSNSLINRIYHALDSFAVRNSDTVWNLSSIMAAERAKVGLNAQKIRKKQLIVPVGTDSDINAVYFNKVQRYHLAHMGHLTEKQGVQSVIEAVPFIVKKVPEFHFDIIGGGPMEEELERRVKELHIDKHVSFYGYIKSHDQVEALLAGCSAAIAPYIDNPDNFVRYTDPGKVKAYLAVGLPVIITKVPDVWKILVEKKAGMAIQDDQNEIAKAVIKMLSDERKLKSYREHALKLGREYSWSMIFSKALDLTLN